MKKWLKSDLYEATSDLEIEGQGHKTIAFVALPIYTHIPNLKGLTKIFFKLSRLKGNLCGGMTVLNPKYPRLSSGDTIKKIMLTTSNPFISSWSFFLSFFSLSRSFLNLLNSSSRPMASVKRIIKCYLSSSCVLCHPLDILSYSICFHWLIIT